MDVSLLKIPLRISKGIKTILVKVATLPIYLNRVAQKNPMLTPERDKSMTERALLQNIY